MPLSSKGQKIMKAMEKTYPSEAKAKSVFYASKNAGKIKGVDEDMSASPMQPSMTSSQPAMDCWAHMRKWHGKPAQDGGPGSGPHERNASGRQQKEVMATSVGMPANTYTRTVNTKSGGDHGSDPLGNGMHRMVPSGDIVTTAEMMKRRGMSKDALPLRNRARDGGPGSGPHNATAHTTPAMSNQAYGKQLHEAGKARRAAAAPGAMKISINPAHAAAAHRVHNAHPMQTPIHKTMTVKDALPMARPAMASKPMMAKPMMPKPAMAKPAMAHGPAMARGPVQSIQRSPTGTKITFHNPMPKPGL